MSHSTHEQSHKQSIEAKTPRTWGTVTDVCDTHVIGYFDCVSIVVWRTEITLAALNALQVNHALVAARHDFVCTLVVAEQTFALPRTEVRAESARLMRTGSPKLRSSVTLLEGSGFWLAAARAAMTAIQLLSSHAYPLEIATSVRDAALQTAEHAGRDVRWSQTLERVITDIRGHRLAPFARSA